MHCQGIACTRSFDMGLTSTVVQKLDCFNYIGNNIFISSMKIQKASHVAKLYQYFLSLRLSLSLCAFYDLYGNDKSKFQNTISLYQNLEKITKVELKAFELKI